MKQMTVILSIMLLLLSCGGRRQLSAEELAHKLDSLKSLEINEKSRQLFGGLCQVSACL